MSGSGWYRLPSGITVHVRADKPLAAGDVDVLDALAQYLRRHVAYSARQQQAWEDDGGRPGPPIPIGPRDSGRPGPSRIPAVLEVRRRQQA